MPPTTWVHCPAVSAVVAPAGGPTGSPTPRRYGDLETGRKPQELLRSPEGDFRLPARACLSRATEAAVAGGLERIVVVRGE